MGKLEGNGPLPRWRALIESGELLPDPQQQRVVERLQSLHEHLTDSGPGLVGRLLGRLRGRPVAVTGLYLHGPVGRGKTMLMDLLVESLAAEDVAVERLHFHRFMDRVHRRLKELEGRRDPLKAIAREMTTRYRVLCFDEFHVSDIGDAMILGELLQALFERGLTLVATSNTVPDELYSDGLQRARFVPAIEAIQAHCESVALDAEEDYRLRELIRHPTWLYPQNAANVAELGEEFRSLAAGESVSEAPLRIRGRDVQPCRRAGSVAWFDFDTLCRGHRSSADYIELSRRFSTLIVQGVPAMDDDDANAVRRFIHLVDECYDRAVKLIIVAAVPIAEAYSGSRLTQPFERTVSRLIEMQSRDYLALPHRS